MPRLRQSLALGLLALFAVATAAAAEPAFPLERFLEVPVIASAHLAPDAERVAWVVRQRSLEDDETRRTLWVAELPGGEPLRLTWQGTSPAAVAWHPAGGALSYLAAVDEGPRQVWLHPLDGSAPRPVTALEQGVSAFWWSPDGGRLALLAPREEVTVEPEGEDDERADWIVYDRLEQPDDFPQLWIAAVDLAGDGIASSRRLTEPPLHAYHAAWSPDGTTIALTFNPRFSSLVDEEQRIGLVDVESGELTPITPADRHASLAAFSPDGRRLAYFRDREAAFRAYLNLKDVAVRELATGSVRVLTEDVALTLGGSGSTPAAPPIWSAAGDALFVPGAERTRLDLYRVGLAEGSLEPVTDLRGNIGAVSIERATLAYVESELHRPGTLWARPLTGDAGAQAVVSTDDAVAAYDLVVPRRMTLPGHDGGTVEGFFFLPPGAAPEGPHPTIIEMHGGPYYRYGNAWTTRYPWQVLAHAGFAVFIANPRGGTGYGEEFLRGVYRNFGTDDYRDLMAATDALVERGIADSERLGFTGYSYGGLMTNTVISRTGRFRAAVSIAGIFNFVSAMGQNNPQLFIDSYRRPWDEDLQRMWEHSPASRAGAISTPTLVMHGLEDHPVDPRQSIELFTYLQLNGVPSRLVLYPEEGHGINRPSHMLDYQTRELEWFRHYLLGDQSAEGAAPPLPVEE
jgi:dipeptidyl aminopeptidase/acylaminoacyl peptidase